MLHNTNRAGKGVLSDVHQAKNNSYALSDSFVKTDEGTSLLFTHLILNEFYDFLGGKTHMFMHTGFESLYLSIRNSEVPDLMDIQT